MHYLGSEHTVTTIVWKSWYGKKGDVDVKWPKGYSVADSADLLIQNGFQLPFSVLS